MSKKLTYIIKLSVIATLVLLLIVGTFCDLSISKTVADLKVGKYFSGNHFANFLEGVGELPTFILLSACIGIFGYNFSKKKEKLKLAVLFATAILSFFVLSYGLIRCVETFAEIYDFSYDISWFGDELCCMLLSVAIIALGVYLGQKLGDKKLEKLQFFALALIIVCVANFGITQVLKEIFSRPRFRTLRLIGDYELFADWYKANPFTDVPKNLLALGVGEDGFKSFPSGHTSWACSLIMLAYLPTFIEGIGKRAKICLWTIPSVFVVVVAFSRILAGAHYLTDVIFSLIFSLIVMELVSFIMLKLQKKQKPKVEIEETALIEE